VTNIHGSLIESKVIKSSTSSISLGENYKQGVYFVYLTFDDKKVTSQKVIKI